MTKQDLQKELKEKVKEGVKPSDIRKLKRSKSVGDIPAAPPPPTNLLQEQLAEKQKEIENLREKLEAKNSLTENSSALDQSLFARHKNLKDWFTQYSKNKALDSELKENIDEASNELVEQDQTISQLRSENKQLKLTNQSLTKDLNLANRLAASRKVPYYSPEDKGTHLKYALYSLMAITFIWLLMK